MTIAARYDTDLYAESVVALTRAAQERNVDGSPCDFCDFLALVLAATAANVGGPDRLIAGRPGSWQAAYVDSLVRGTMGDLPDEWTWCRTQPILVRLNVAQLIEDGLHHPGLMGLDEALENLGKRYESADREQDLDAWDSDIDRYTSEYRLYAQRFTLAAHSVANIISGLSIEVHVEADADPNSTWWSTTATNNPSQSDSDQLALEIWHAARDLTPLPNVDIWLSATLGARSHR
jgi:hypothetical protein